MKNYIKKTIYWLPRIVILIFAILILIFALLSGAADYGNGLTGILKNSPNAIPWLILLVIVYVAWRWEKIGGWLLITIAIISFIFFNGWENISTSLILILPILIVGILFLVSNRIRRL